MREGNEHRTMSMWNKVKEVQANKMQKINRKKGDEKKTTEPNPPPTQMENMDTLQHNGCASLTQWEYISHDVSLHAKYNLFFYQIVLVPLLLSRCCCCYYYNGKLSLLSPLFPYTFSPIPQHPSSFLEHEWIVGGSKSHLHNCYVFSSSFVRSFAKT